MKAGRTLVGAVLGLLAAGTVGAAPAQASERTVEIIDVDITEQVRAGRACAFPIEIVGRGTTKVVTKGDRISTYNYRDSYFTVKNLANGRTVRLDAHGEFHDRVQANGDLKSKGRGNTFYSSLNEGGGVGFSANPGVGVYYIQGKVEFSVLDPAGAYTIVFHRAKGTVTDVCRLIR